ncbi:MAG: autotransporter assembly complex protein TamA, partial [Janthinobacterium lividum]
MNRRPALRHAILIAAALLASPSARGSDPQPYTVELAPTGNGALDQTLSDSSNLIKLRESAPAGPFALVMRAQGDAGRLMTALNSYGYYAAKVSIRIAGRDVADPALPAALEAATASVPVAVGIQPGPLFHLRHVTLDGGVPPEGRAALHLEDGAPAIASDVLAAQGRVLDALRKSGHALAKVDAPVVMLDPAAQVLDVSYKVDAGPRVNLGPIGIGGLDRVNPAFVRRRLLVHPGDRFDPDKIEEARQDLASLGVFATVQAHAAERLNAAGDLPLDYAMTERPRHVVGFTAAFSTDLGA